MFAIYTTLSFALLSQSSMTRIETDSPYFIATCPLQLKERILIQYSLHCSGQKVDERIIHQHLAHRIQQPIPKRLNSNFNKPSENKFNTIFFVKNNLITVFPRIVSAETILFWKLGCGKYSREETIQGRKLLFLSFQRRKVQGRKLEYWLRLDFCKSTQIPKSPYINAA